MPFPTITWRVDADGNWGTANNWKPLRVPTFSDDVAINTVHLHTVTHSGGADRAHTLTVGADNFVVSGGILSIGSTSSFGRLLTISGGQLGLGGAATVSGLLTVSGGVLALGGATTAASFAQGAGTVSGTGALTVSGAAAFTGTLAQTGSGVTLLKGASTFNGSVFGLDGGRTLENQGTLTVAGNALRLGFNPFGASLGGGVLKNDPGGTIDLQGASFIETFSGATSFTNAGTLKKTTSTIASIIGLAVTNTGAVLVQGGTLEFAGGGFTNSGPGTISISSGATLRLEGAASAAAGAFTLASGATLDVAFGTLTLGAGTVGGPGTLKLEAGALVLGGGVTISGAFAQSGGIVSGTGNLAVTGPAAFSGTVLETGAATTFLKGASTLADGADLNLDGDRILENQGVFTLLGSGEIHLGADPFGPGLGGGILANDAGAIIDIQGTNHIVAITGTAGLVNGGDLRRTAGTGRGVIDVALTNTGRVLAQAGTLELDGALFNLASGRLSVSSGAALNLFGGGFANAGAFTLASGATLDFFGNAFSLGGGTVAGTGTVELTGGTLFLGAGVTLGGAFAQSSGILSGSGGLSVAGPATFTSKILQTGAGATLLKGASTLTGGELSLDGGRVLENQGAMSLSEFELIRLGHNPFGATLGGGTLKNDAGATIDLQDSSQVVASAGDTSFINAGTLKKTVGAGSAIVNATFIDTGTVRIASGALQFQGVGDSFAGLVSGAGTLIFAGGTHAFNGSASVTVSNWSLFAGAVATVNENLGYAGALSQGAGTTLTIATGDTLSLTGTAILSGTVNGAGTVTLARAALDALTVGGAATLSAVGIVDQTGAVTIGDAGTMAATLSIAAGATYAFDNDSGVARGAAVASSIKNGGLLIKLGGTGISVIGVQIADTGSIEAASGTLDFTRAINGNGAMAVDSGATLEVDASASAGLDMTFNGGGATLALSDPANFAATIHAFNPGDTIDLLGIKATAASLGAGNTLVITNGSKAVATLQLAGNHANDVFTVGSDAQGGTSITIAAPGPGRITNHPFIAAMAGFGGGDGGPAPTWPEPRADAWRPTLSAPRMTRFA